MWERRPRIEFCSFCQLLSDFSRKELCTYGSHRNVPFKKVFFVCIFHLNCHWRLQNAHRPVGEASDSHSLKTIEHLRINNDNTYLLAGPSGRAV